MMPASTELSSAPMPSVGETTLLSISVMSRGSAPERIRLAVVWASSMELKPVMMPEPPVMALLILGAVSVSPSSMMESTSPTCAPV